MFFIKQRSKILYSCSFLFVASCAPTLAGKLNSPSGDLNNFQNARVNIVSIETKKPSSYIVVVSKDGSFVLDESLEKGRYLIEALVPGYKVVSTEIDLSQTKKVVLDLVALPQKGASSVGVNMDIDASRGTGGATLTPPRL